MSYSDKTDTDANIANVYYAAQYNSIYATAYRYMHLLLYMHTTF